MSSRSQKFKQICSITFLSFETGLTWASEVYWCLSYRMNNFFTFSSHLHKNLLSQLPWQLSSSFHNICQCWCDIHQQYFSHLTLFNIPLSKTTVNIFFETWWTLHGPSIILLESKSKTYSYIFNLIFCSSHFEVHEIQLLSLPTTCPLQI